MADCVAPAVRFRLATMTKLRTSERKDCIRATRRERMVKGGGVYSARAESPAGCCLLLSHRSMRKAASGPTEQSVACKATAPTSAGAAAPFEDLPLAASVGAKLVSMQPPVLTQEVKDQNLQGDVFVQCVITENGSLEDCCVRKGVHGLGVMVVKAVQTWRYEPVTRDGRRVRMPYMIRVKIVQSSG